MTDVNDGEVGGLMVLSVVHRGRELHRLLGDEDVSRAIFGLREARKHHGSCFVPQQMATSISGPLERVQQGWEESAPMGQEAADATWPLLPRHLRELMLSPRSQTATSSSPPQ